MKPGYWLVDTNIRSFLKDLEREYNIHLHHQKNKSVTLEDIKQLSDWYTISTSQVYKIGGEVYIILSLEI